MSPGGKDGDTIGFQSFIWEQTETVFENHSLNFHIFIYIYSSLFTPPDPRVQGGAT